MKRIICWAKAIPFWIRSGVWCPHIYVEESREPAIIIANDKGFRVAQNYMHYHDETVYPKATFIRSRCDLCMRTNSDAPCSKGLCGGERNRVLDLYGRKDGLRNRRLSCMRMPVNRSGSPFPRA